MNRAFAVLFVLFAMLLPCLAYGAGSPVVVTHTLTGYSKGADAVTLDYALHVVNPGDTPLSEIILILVPRPPLTRSTTVNVGYLGPHQRADVSLQLVTSRIVDQGTFSRSPLFWAGTCLDLAANPVEFPVKSSPGGAR